MAAPLIIQDQRDRPDQQEVVLMLADFSFTPPEQIFEGLKKAKGMAGMAGSAGAAPASAMGSMPGTPKGDAPNTPDLNDVKYDAFLANDRTLADPEVIKVEPGGRVLLRIINSSSMSAYHIDLGAARRRVDRRGRLPGHANDRAPLPDRRRAAPGHPRDHPA